jgi:S1-C subfamily serine protease
MRLLLALFSVCWCLVSVAQQPSLLERTGQEVSRVVKRALPAIVTVEARIGGRLVRSSGFVIDSSGSVVCAAEGVRMQLQVSLYLSEGEPVRARVVGVDNITGIALLRPEVNLRLSSLNWGESERLPLGSTLILIGNRSGLEGSVTVGTLGGKDRVGVRRDNQRVVLLMQFNGTVSSGEQGAPLLDSQGRVVGVMVGELASVEGAPVSPVAVVGFAIPSEIAQRVVNDLRTKGRAEHAWLGIDYQGLPSGVVVRRVAQGSPAQQAGIQVGDIITQYNDKPIRAASDLTRELYFAQPNQRITLTVQREGQQARLPVTLGVQSL